MNRLMVAGTGSGCGKTTISCALLAAFKKIGKSCVSFKCGPDYIDPMFHRKASLAYSYNLDVFLMGEENVRYALWRNGQGADLCLIEGVMGLYDGVGSGSYASANHLSLITETPVVLVVDVRGKAQSICAEIYGHMKYDRNNVSAVILNNVTESMYPFYKELIEEKLAVSVMGFMPDIPEAHFDARHLGLVTPDEIAGIKSKINLLAESALRYIDIEKLWDISSNTSQIAVENDFLLNIKPKHRPKIYIACDEAFCFFYEDNHKLLEAYGAELCFFSPLNDRELPEDADGIILWGGYPEQWAERLSCNLSMKESIKHRIERGLLVYAECGGFIYMQDMLTDLGGNTYPMLGVIKGHAKMTGRLQNFGYVELTASCDNMLCGRGGKINAHSFHYSISDNEGEVFTAVKKRGGSSYPCVVAYDNVFASFLHIHFWGNIEFAERFVNACGE